MKCIAKGQDPGAAIWRGACHKCAARFEAERREMEPVEHDPRAGGSFKAMNCPECKAAHSVFMYPA